MTLYLEPALCVMHDCDWLRSKPLKEPLLALISADRLQHVNMMKPDCSKNYIFIDVFIILEGRGGGQTAILRQKKLNDQNVSELFLVRFPVNLLM